MPSSYNDVAANENAVASLLAHPHLLLLLGVNYGRGRLALSRSHSERGREGRVHGFDPRPRPPPGLGGDDLLHVLLLPALLRGRRVGPLLLLSGAARGGGGMKLRYRLLEVLRVQNLVLGWRGMLLEAALKVHPGVVEVNVGVAAALGTQQGGARLQPVRREGAGIVVLVHLGDLGHGKGGGVEELRVGTVQEIGHAEKGGARGG